jgi:hypothetical protein
MMTAGIQSPAVSFAQYRPLASFAISASFRFAAKRWGRGIFLPGLLVASTRVNLSAIRQGGISVALDLLTTLRVELTVELVLRWICLQSEREMSGRIHCRIN